MQGALRWPWSFHGQARQRSKRRSMPQSEGAKPYGRIAVLRLVAME
jgi:hypothetical protein